MTNETKPDLMAGYAEIGSHLGMSERQVEALVLRDQSFPTFKLPNKRTVYALRSKVDAWLADKAAQSNVEGGGDRGGE